MPESYKGIEYETVLAWVDEGIGYLQFNRPNAMNAVNLKMLKESTDIMNSFSIDDEVKVIILFGNEHIFCAGADLQEVATMNPFEAGNYLEAVRGSQTAIEENLKPTIAAVRGLALGGGLELMLTSDIRIAGDNTTFGLPEINLGIMPGGGATQRWLRNGTMCTAKYYAFTGDFFDAQAALNMGMINKVVPAADVMDTAVKLAKKIAKKPPLALRELKRSINNSVNMDLKSGLRAEQTSWSLLFASQDQKEGMQAFMENRKAVFSGK